MVALVSNQSLVTISIISPDEGLISYISEKISGPDYSRRLEEFGWIDLKKSPNKIGLVAVVESDKVGSVTSNSINVSRDLLLDLSRSYSGRSGKPPRLILLGMVDPILPYDPAFTFLMAVSPGHLIYRVIKRGIEDLALLYTYGSAVVGAMILTKDLLNELLNEAVRNGEVKFELIEDGQVSTWKKSTEKLSEKISVIYAWECSSTPCSPIISILRAMASYFERLADEKSGSPEK